MSDSNKKITQIINNLLSSLQVQPDQYQVDFQDDQITLNIQVPEDQTGLFIGRHGENINALRLLLSLIISQRLDIWPHLRLNVNDYQEKRNSSLLQLADNAVEKAVQLQREIILPNLSSYERRLIHLHIEDNPQVITESRGESPDRQLVIIPQVD